LTECAWEFGEWKASGGKVLLISVALQGPRGERKTWQFREEQL